jgi:hypothetical protein
MWRLSVGWNHGDTRPLGRCIPCDKFSYGRTAAHALVQRLQAQAAARSGRLSEGEVPADVPQRAYVCPVSSLMWHVTKLAVYVEPGSQPVPERTFVVPAPPERGGESGGWLDAGQLEAWVAVASAAVVDQGDGLLWPSARVAGARFDVQEKDVRRLRSALVKAGWLSLWRHGEVVTSPSVRLDPNCGSLVLVGTVHPEVPEALRGDAVAAVLADAVKGQGGGLVLGCTAEVSARYGVGLRAVRHGRELALARGCFFRWGTSYVSAPGWGASHSELSATLFEKRNTC